MIGFWACRNPIKPAETPATSKVEVAGVRCRRRNRKMWNECVEDDNDMKVLGLYAEWEVFKDMWRDFIWANVKA